MLNFKDKKVLIFGLGSYPEGSGVSAACFFIQQGAEVTITDMKRANELQNNIRLVQEEVKKQKKQGKNSKVNFCLGRHRLSDVRAADLVIRNPGVPMHSPYLHAARRRGIPIETDVSIFMQLCPCRVIGITGTRGKSTTTTLYGEMARHRFKVFVGGNIQRSPLTFLNKIDKKSLVVLELSSWLLESLVDIKKSPNAALVTNIYEDHLNIHKTMKNYITAKENIFKFQEEGNIIVLNRDNSYTKKMEKNVAKGAIVSWFSIKPFKGRIRGAYIKDGWIIVQHYNQGFTWHAHKVIKVKDMKLEGGHNVANALAACALAHATGLALKDMTAALKTFRGIPSRQEAVRSLREIIYINDTTATTPEAAMAALERFGKKRKVVLIAGGADKKLKFSKFVQAIKKYCKAVVLLDGSGTKKIEPMFRGNAKFLGVYGSMASALHAVRGVAEKGDTILLSPGCASFGIFKNEFDRGEQFVRLVKGLK